MNTVDQFISRQEREKREIIEALRHLILEAAPKIEERLAHDIPFYYYHGRLCYINTARHGVDLGFCRGAELSNDHGLLESKDRIEVRTIRLTNLRDFPSDKIREMLQEAILLNEWYDKYRMH